MEAIGMVLLAIVGMVWLSGLIVWIAVCFLAARKWKRPAQIVGAIGVVIWLVPVVFVSHGIYYSWFVDEPFGAAMWEHRFGDAKVLLEKGADPNRDVEGLYPLAAAADAGDTEMVQLLLRHGADPDALTNLVFQKYTALGVARKNGHEDVVKLLKKAGAKKCVYLES